MKIHLGVIDVPYSDKIEGAKETTHEVAMDLEYRYQIMELYIKSRAKFIDETLAKALKDALFAKMKGLPVPKNVIAGADDRIESDFRAWLDAESHGIPRTLAGQKGIRHRFKQVEHGLPRPSFIDTGLYQQSFRVWLED